MDISEIYQLASVTGADAIAGPVHGNALLMIGIALLLGAMIQIFAHRMHIPAIVPLLLAGVLLGPEVMGALIPGHPGLIAPQSIPHDMLEFIIKLSVAIILFEGGLGLDIKGFQSSPVVIRRLLTIGVGITWLGTAGVIWYLYQDDYGEHAIRVALLLASLVIVTGPTVIQPILRKVNVKENLHHILLWESVLIDAIGVFIAILSLEWMLNASVAMTFAAFFGRFMLGLAFGLIGGLALDFTLRNNRISVEHVNITTLGMAIFLFSISDSILPESGLLTVCVAGFVVAYRNPPRLKQITEFKQELTELAVSVLFIVLAANLRFEDFATFLDHRGITLILILLLVIRPLSIFICTTGRSMKKREKLFLSWMAPRGIVAAAMASVFALTLSARNDPGLEGLDRTIQAFVFSVIAVSVIVQGLSAGLVAKILRVKAPPRSGWLIVGAHRLGREVASFLQETVGVSVHLIDTNNEYIRLAQQEGLNAEVFSATEKSYFDRDSIIGVGNILSLTNNGALNKVICRTWSEIIPNENLWRWSPAHDDHDADADDEGRPVFNLINNPVMLSWELERSKARLLPVSIEARSNREHVKVLMTALKDNTVTFASADENDGDNVLGRLVLHRWSLDLVHLTRSEFISRDSETDRDTLLETLVSRLAKIHNKIDQGKMLRDLISREQSFSTALGNGVAVPHTYCDTLTESICMISRLPEGIDFGGHTGGQVQLVFLLASPPGDPEHHLKILAEIASLCSNRQFVDNLVSAPQAADVLSLLEISQHEKE